MAKLGIRPIGDKVIIERVNAEQTTAGGIVLPDSAKEKPKRGVIRATGDGRLLDDGSRSSMQVSTGDEVLFTSYAGTEVKVDGNEFIIMDESEVLAVLS